MKEPDSGEGGTCTDRPHLAPPSQLKSVLTTAPGGVLLRQTLPLLCSGPSELYLVSSLFPVSLSGLHKPTTHTSDAISQFSPHAAPTSLRNSPSRTLPLALSSAWDALLPQTCKTLALTVQGLCSNATFPDYLIEN